LLILGVLVAGCIGGGDEADTTVTVEDDISGGDDSGAREPTQDTKDSGSPSEGGILSDIKAAVGSGIGYKCEYSADGMDAVTYLKGERQRTEGEINGERIGYIFDGTWAYMWMQNEPEGTKYELSKMMDSLDDETRREYEQMDISQQADVASDIRCVPYAVGDAMFRPPAGINFRDITQMMVQSMEMADRMQAGEGMDFDDMDLCSLCEMIPDAQARAECLRDC
jgi:hypothetical protein